MSEQCPDAANLQNGRAAHRQAYLGDYISGHYYSGKKLDWCRLNDRETRSDFDNPLHAKPCICQQGRELIRCAFLSVRGHEHVQIGGFRLKAVVRTPDDPFYDQKFCFRMKYPAACCQDRERGGVVPIVKDIFEQVSVATLGNGLEETASHHGAPFGDTRRFQYRLRPCHDVRSVKQDAMSVGMCCEDSGDHRALTTSDVHDTTERREVVS